MNSSDGTRLYCGTLGVRDDVTRHEISGLVENGEIRSDHFRDHFSNEIRAQTARFAEVKRRYLKVVTSFSGEPGQYIVWVMELAWC